MNRTATQTGLYLGFPRHGSVLFRAALMLVCLCPVFLFSRGAQAESRKIVAIAHRGEHLHNPENTVHAFQEAIRLGADFIEVDVRTTSDGKLVLSHDGS